MPKRLVVTVTDVGSGLIFGFWPDKVRQGVLHIAARHGTTPEEAIETFLTGLTVWDEVHLRFETFSETHGLYWFWWERDRRVGIISCFRREDI